MFGNLGQQEMKMIRKFVPVSVPTKAFWKEGERRKHGIARFCELVRQVPVVTGNKYRTSMQADRAGACITVKHKVNIESYP